MMGMENGYPKEIFIKISSILNTRTRKMDI
jgi:hypothetical protein